MARKKQASTWSKLWQPSQKWYLLWLPSGAFVAVVVGVVASTTFNLSMSYTNSNKFCYSCHVGMDTIVEEYEASIHFSTQRGVAKATCADCHVPKDFIPKMVTKIRATKDIYHMLAGTINMENFESHRLRLANHVWDVYDASDSLACKNCHDPNKWDLSLQPTRARVNHNPALWEKEQRSCIDCHQGTAHKAPSL